MAYFIQHTTNPKKSKDFWQKNTQEICITKGTSNSNKLHTKRSAVVVAPHATGCSETGSAKRESCELPGLVSALRGRANVDGTLFDDNDPEAEEGLELVPHALVIGSCVLSLPAVEGRVPLPPDEGRDLR